MPMSGVLPKHVVLTKTDTPYLVFETVGNSPMHTIATTAAAVGRNKTAILRANKGGEISVTKDKNNEW